MTKKPIEDTRKYTLYLTEKEMKALAYLLKPFATNNGQGVMSLSPDDFITYQSLYNIFRAMLTQHQRPE